VWELAVDFYLKREANPKKKEPPDENILQRLTSFFAFSTPKASVATAHGDDESLTNALLLYQC
jgi:hypothetical protein